MKRPAAFLTEPLGLLILVVVTFGLVIPWLGFYWDDWPILLTAHTGGAAGLWEFYQYDRPPLIWTYLITMPLLGENPFAWHTAALLLRWLTAVAVWWTLSAMWPRFRQEAGWAAFLFAVYPVFYQQAIAVTYTPHWISYLLTVVSLGCMVQAWRNPHRAGLFTALGVLAALLQMFTMEYFVGLELLRPVMLWFLVGERVEGQRPPAVPVRLRAVVLRWLPYLLALAVYAVWRLFFLDLAAGDENAPVLVHRIVSSPLSGLLRLVQLAFQDTLYLIAAVWSKTITPASIDLTDRFTLLTWGAALLAGGFTAAWLLRSRPSPTAPAASGRWEYQALVVGLAAVLLPMLPVWLTDRQIIRGMYSDRFGLPAVLGASLVIAALVRLLIRGRTKQVIVLAVLTGLSVGFLLRGVNEFRWARINQNRFYWQLAWRAPSIEPGTALFAHAEVLGRMGMYATASGINLLYPEQLSGAQMSYWFFSVSEDFGDRMSELLNGARLEDGFRHLVFQGESQGSLILYYEPSEGDCLRVLTPQDADDPALARDVAEALPIIDLARIQPGGAGASRPSEDLFGPEPEHGWCYFYQKADLARQIGNWAQAAQMGDQAQAQGYTLDNSQSNTPQEWIPFIEAYAWTGRWDEARSLTRASQDRNPRLAGRLCDLWQDIRSQNPSASAETVDGALNELGCD